MNEWNMSRRCWLGWIETVTRARTRCCISYRATTASSWRPWRRLIAFRAPRRPSFRSAAPISYRRCSTSVTCPFQHRCGSSSTWLHPLLTIWRQIPAGTSSIRLLQCPRHWLPLCLLTPFFSSPHALTDTHWHTQTHTHARARCFLHCLILRYWFNERN